MPHPAVYIDLLAMQLQQLGGVEHLESLELDEVPVPQPRQEGLRLLGDLVVKPVLAHQLDVAHPVLLGDGDVAPIHDQLRNRATQVKTCGWLADLIGREELGEDCFDQDVVVQGFAGHAPHSFVPFQLLCLVRIHLRERVQLLLLVRDSQTPIGIKALI